jgi:hypothetical protein
MIERVTEEIHGSDRVPGLNGLRASLGWNGHNRRGCVSVSVECMGNSDGRFHDYAKPGSPNDSGDLALREVPHEEDASAQALCATGNWRMRSLPGTTCYNPPRGGLNDKLSGVVRTLKMRFRPFVVRFSSFQTAHTCITMASLSTIFLATIPCRRIGAT